MNQKRFFGADVPEALAAVEREFGPEARIVSTERRGRGVCVVAEPARLDLVSHRESDWRDQARGFGLPDAMLSSLARDLRGAPASDVGVLAARLLAARIRTAPAFAARVQALVGPTGVGKTTTVAKLAAQARALGRDVRLVTLDVARPGGVEQLRAFAATLDLAVEVATTSRALLALASERRAGELVLVDTAGRAPHDRAARHATIEALRAIDAQALICLQANSRRADASATLAAWKAAEPAALVVTKWDETATPGEVVALAIERELPLAWITVGQVVPGDLVSADATLVAAHALGLDESRIRALSRPADRRPAMSRPRADGGS